MPQLYHDNKAKTCKYLSGSTMQDQWLAGAVFKRERERVTPVPTLIYPFCGFLFYSSSCFPLLFTTKALALSQCKCMMLVCDNRL